MIVVVDTFIIIYGRNHPTWPLEIWNFVIKDVYRQDYPISISTISTYTHLWKWKSVSDCVTDLQILRLTREDFKMTWLTLSWNKLGRPVPGWRSSGWSAYQLHKVWSLHLKHLITDGYVCYPIFACRTCRRKQTIKFIQNCWIKKSENILQLYYLLLNYVASSADFFKFLPTIHWNKRSITWVVVLFGERAFEKALEWTGMTEEQYLWEEDFFKI